MNTTAQHTTTLADKALLVSLTICKPQMTEKDKQTTGEVALDKGASTAAVSVVKKLYPKHLLQPIQQVETAARQHLLSVTQPWARGMSLLPSKLFMSLQAEMGTFKLQHRQAVTVFLNNYAGVMAEAAREQGAMFDATNYPDLSTLAAEFTFDVTYLPLGSVPSMMDGLSAEVLEDVRSEVEAQTRQTLAVGQKALYDRLASALTRIKVQCGNPDGKIYETLTGNLDEMLKVLPDLNLANDPTFTQLCEEARALVVPTAAIKTVPGVRESMASTADDILAKMAAFM